MIKKMIYKGHVILKGGNLGLCFKEKDTDKEIYWKGKDIYCIGDCYEFDFSDDGFRVGKYCEEFNERDPEKIKDWEIASMENKKFKERELLTKRRKKQEGIILNMSLRELKERVDNDWRFKKLIFFYLMGGSL